MLEKGTAVVMSSLNIRAEIEVFASMWVKPNSPALATNPAMWLNLPLAHMVERATSGNLLSLARGRLKSSPWSRSLYYFEASVPGTRVAHPLTFTECISGREIGLSCSCPVMKASVLRRASSSEY